MNSFARWIWDKEHTLKNDWVMFKQSFEVTVLDSYTINISVDTRYFMWINDKIVVWDGGLFRDAYCENSGYIDSVDISSFVKIGENELKILVWHYGNGGRNNSPLGSAGLIFCCEALDLYSDEHTLCARHPSFKETGEPLPSDLFGGYNIHYDANFEVRDYHPSTVVDFDFGTLYERPVPLFTLSDIAECEYEKKGNVYSVKLPTALHVMPYFEVVAEGDELIDIRHDRYKVPGGPGGGGVGLYNGHRTEYRCKKGENSFLGFDYMPCEILEFFIPNSIKIKKLGYAISEYPTELAGLFRCEEERVNILLKKCVRTLKFCMRDNFMDCPDRERGQWIGDVSVQAPQVFYALDNNGVLLLKKAILNFILLRKGDVLVGNVPGINFQELPSQSLNAISELGMISQYYYFTGDKELLKICLEPMVAYLKLWDVDDDGMVVRREGDWCWFDHLNNQDKVILENCWYYSALCFSKRVCDILGDKKHCDFLQNRIDGIKNSFDRLFWKEKFYASGEIVDDRANAMAVVVGLAKSEHYFRIKNVLVSTYNASTYMEGYVCEALFMMGYDRLAYNRMMYRYLPLIENENSTLWEDFAILGTKNHAWTGAPLTLFYRYIAGISVDCESKKIQLNPKFDILKQHRYSMNIGGGTFTVQDDKIIENTTEFEVTIS